MVPPAKHAVSILNRTTQSGIRFHESNTPDGRVTTTALPAGEAPEVVPRPDEPWIESREGMLFFVNALFVIPEYCVLFPLGLRTLLRSLGLASGPSVFLDTLPTLATHCLPYVGWFLVVPIVLIFKTFSVEGSGERSRWRRGALSLFLVSHLGFLGYTLRLWLGV
jgi:hypothetical protein